MRSLTIAFAALAVLFLSASTGAQSASQQIAAPTINTALVANSNIQTANIVVDAAPVVETALPAVLVDRVDCAQIRLDPDYRSDNERLWFLTNCVLRVDAAYALQLQPLTTIATPTWATAPVVVQTAPVQTAPSTASAPVQKATQSVQTAPVQAQAQTYPAPDYCNNTFPSFAVGVKQTITGCYLIGDVQLLEGNEFVRKYDNDASTGLITDCMTRVCTFIPDFAGANASSRSIQDFNSREGCGPGCRFTTVQQVPFEASCKHEGFSLLPRAREKIEMGCTVSGDISVNTDPSGGGEYTKLYVDGKPATTGTLYTCKNKTGCWIMAGETWGASVSADTADNIAAGMRNHGCVNGCLVVNRN